MCFVALECITKFITIQIVLFKVVWPHETKILHSNITFIVPAQDCGTFIITKSMFLVIWLTISIINICIQTQEVIFLLLVVWFTHLKR